MLNSRNSYYIFSVTGHVEVNNNGWHKAKKHEVVNLQTEFKINSGEIVIVDKKDGLTFKYRKQTSTPIQLREIIRESKTNRIFLILSTIKEALTPHDVSRISFRTIGGVTLGIGNQIEKDLSDMIQSYAFAKNGKSLKYLNNGLILSREKCGQGIFHFKITNQTSDNLFVNIVALNTKSNTFSFPLDVLMNNNYNTLDGLCLYVPAYSALNLEQFEFILNNNIQYRVFGSTQYFENHNVANIISGLTPSYYKEINSPYHIYFGVSK